MSPRKWWSVILTMGLFVALSPLGAQAAGLYRTRFSGHKLFLSRPGD